MVDDTSAPHLAALRREYGDHGLDVPDLEPDPITMFRRWMDDTVEGYLTGLAELEHADPILTEMEARADEHGFPIVGRATGRYLELVARTVGARR